VIFEGRRDAMTTTVRRRFWWEAGLAAATAILTIVTLINTEWIELVFGVDPDNGSGALEWGIVGALAVASVIAGLVARYEWQRGRAISAA
jgi:Mg2+/Co2+ transporter CorB